MSARGSSSAVRRPHPYQLEVTAARIAQAGLNYMSVQFQHWATVQMVLGLGQD